MALTTTPVFPQTPNNGKVQIARSDGLATKSIYTGGANGSKVFAVIGASTSTGSIDVQFSIIRSGTTYLMGTQTFTTGAGASGSVPSVNVFGSTQIPGLPIDSDNNPFLFLKDASDVLSCAALSTVATATFITLTAFVADF